MVVGKLKLIAVPIDDEETAFRYTKPRGAKVVEIIMGRSHDGSVQPLVCTENSIRIDWGGNHVTSAHNDRAEADVQRPPLDVSF
jgi:hypothetical protein